MLTKGFWSMLSMLLITGGGFFMLLGFGGDQMALGLTGVVVTVLGIVVLVNRFRDILSEFGIGRHWWRL